MADRKAIQLQDGLGNLYDIKDAEARENIDLLQSAITQLDEQINGENVLTPEEKTTSDFEEIHYYIGTNAGKWVEGGTSVGLSSLGDLTGCAKVSITATSGKDARIAFLQDDSCTAGETPNYAGGATMPTVISAGETYEADVPSDATLLYVYKKDMDGWTIFPSEVLFYYYVHGGGGIADDLEDLQEQVNGLDLSDMDDVVITSPSNGQILEYDGTAEKWKNAGTLLSLANTVNGLEDDVDDLNEQINGTQTLIPTTKTVSEFTAIDYTINYLNGKWAYATNRSYLGNLGNAVKVSLTANSSYAAQVALIGEDTPTDGNVANIVGAELPTIIASGESVELEVPSNAKQIYIRRIDNDGHNLVPSSIVFYSYGSSGDGLVDEIDELVNTMNELDDSIEELQNEVVLSGGISYKWIDGYKINSYSFNNTNYAGNYETDSSQSIAVADIKAFAGGIIKGRTQLSDGCGIAFYDKHGTFISGLGRPSGAAYDWSFSDVDVPAASKTVVVTCKTSNKSTFSLNGEKLVCGVTNIETGQAIEYDLPDAVFGLDSAKSDFHYDSETRLNDVYTWYDILASSFPRNITKVQIGTTTMPTVYASVDDNTYPIYAYIIQGDRYVSGNEFILTSGIHGDGSGGDGIQSVVALAYFIRDMLSNPQKNKYLSFMKYNCKILVVPVLNPWGYQNGYRGNGRNVDINRNFDYNFEPDVIAEDTTSGPEAFSENESTAIATYIEENFSAAKFLHDFHTRGQQVLQTDDRWFTNTTDTNTELQAAVTASGNWMKRLYGGTVSNNTGTAASLHSTLRAYSDQVIGVPAMLMECMKSINSDVTTFNSDMVQRQYTQYVGSLIQAEVNAMLM